jgi:hypothetical protein
MEICKSRLFRRSLMIHSVRRQRGSENCKQIRLFQRFALDRSDRHFTTLLCPKDRNLPLDGRFPLSKRSSCFRHKNLKACVTRNYAAPSADLSLESSTDGGTLLNKNDSFELFLDTFPQTIKQNVKDIISKVDDVPLPIGDPINETRILVQANVDPGDKLESEKKRTSLSLTKNSLQKRWERMLGTERERQRRNKRIRSDKRDFQRNKRDFQRAKPSIETQWDDAFRRNGYCIIPMSPREERNEEPGFDRFGVVGDLSETDKRNESPSGIYLSPIFRLQVDQQQCLIDFETPLSIVRKDYDDLINHVEVRPVDFNKAINDEQKKGNRIDAHNKVILESISLLIAMTPEDWRKYDSNVRLNVERNMNNAENSDLHHEMFAEQEFVNDDTNLNQIHTNRNKTQHFLRHVMEHKYVLTTSLVNLLLAHLVTSTEIENQETGDGCLQIFKEMKMLVESGQHECRPDSTTYRILILAFSRRFQGMGEAVKLSQDMVEYSSININPELLNEALRACRAKAELTVARSLMNSALSNDQIRINAGSCIIYTEMLKTRKLHEEAIYLFSRIKKVRRFHDNGVRFYSYILSHSEDLKQNPFISLG